MSVRAARASTDNADGTTVRFACQTCESGTGPRRRPLAARIRPRPGNFHIRRLSPIEARDSPLPSRGLVPFSTLSVFGGKFAGGVGGCGWVGVVVDGWVDRPIRVRSQRRADRGRGCVSVVQAPRRVWGIGSVIGTV